MPVVVAEGAAVNIASSGGGRAVLNLVEGVTSRVDGVRTSTGYRFELPAGLPAGKAIPYIVTVTAESTTCTTGGSSLALFIGDSTGRVDVDNSGRVALVRAARSIFEFAAAAAGARYTSESDVADLCADLFRVNPKPCDVQALMARTVSPAVESGSALPPPTRVVKVGSGGVSTLSTLCKTIRYRNTSSDSGYWYWSSFSTTTPSSTTAFTTGSATAARHSSQIGASLYADIVTGTPFGTEHYSVGRGNVGFWAQLAGPVGTITVEPRVRYRVLGRGHAEVYGVPQIPGDGEAKAQIAVFPKSSNFEGGTGSGGDGPAYVSNTITQTPVINLPQFTWKDWDHNGDSGNLPSLTLQDGDLFSAYVWARAESLARTAGATGAGATTNFEEPSGYDVFATSADFTITSPSDVWWDDPIHCVA